MRAILMEELAGTNAEFSSQIDDSQTARLEFVIRVPEGSADTDLTQAQFARIEHRLIEAARSWDDDLNDLLDDVDPDEASAIQLVARSLPGGYRAHFNAAAGVEDVRELQVLMKADAESASPTDLPMVAAGISLRLFLDDEPDGSIVDSQADLQDKVKTRLKIYTLGHHMRISTVMPLLQHLGLQVLDVRTYDFDVPTDDGPMPAWIYQFGLAAKFNDAFAAAWSGVSESDRLNRLVLGAGVTWREVALLRALGRYVRMGTLSFSKELVDSAIAANPHIAQMLIDLFYVLFDPSTDESNDTRARKAERIRKKVRTALVDVASLDEDRTLSALFRIIMATLRTNYFQKDQDNHTQPYISLKLDPSAIPELPAPKPYREIWVHSPQFEGTHLRFGEIARGGLRWSDRRDDMRTEILGLVKAQMVKNTVIVPTGAKGGFLPKRLPDPDLNRDAWLAEGVACYRAFIRSMLEITDNRAGDTIMPPVSVVRRDDDDPYLVVAADKGTAAFSDYANEESVNAGYWLGDAFASGGSVGYDHKDMGITERGAWESVKRHFRELGTDTQSDEFTAVGIGDMSGDVFGNGMLRSEQLRLVAAFDHRHIFIDPNPDAAATYPERQRLFALPRSSWDDYNRDLISRGGGIWPRTTKSIPISDQVRTALGISGKAAEMPPNEVSTTRMLDAFVRHEALPQKIVLTSSRAVYGEGAWTDKDGAVTYPGQRSRAMLDRGEWDFPGLTAQPFNSKTVVPQPTSVYGSTKLAQENILLSWCLAMNVTPVLYRLQNVYGPGQSLINPYTGIVSLFAQKAKVGEVIPVYEDGEIIRDFVLIDDVASAIVAGVLHSDGNRDAYDVGSGEGTSILRLAQLIAKHYGAPEPQINGMFRDGDVRHASCTIDDTIAALSWKPQVTVEEGVRRLCDWIDAKVD